MFRIIFCLGLICVTSLLCGDGGIRGSSAPYISGDTFRSFADHVFDEVSKDFKAKNVEYGDVVFVKGDLLGGFLKKKHPYIVNPYVLVTHNSDTHMPGAFESVLDDPKILLWFAQNIEGCVHKKLKHLPIGLANRHWRHGSVEKISSVKLGISDISKKHLLYLNISVGSYPVERQFVYDKFKDKSYCLNALAKPYQDYLEELASCKFALSPRGNGLDCHRTWECLYLGVIPIVKASSLDPMYEGLPVLIVRDWEEVTEEFLEVMYDQMLGREYNFEKLYEMYWYDEITKFRKRA